MLLKSNNILIATTDLSTGGLGSYLVTLSAGLKVRGWQVHLLSTNIRGDLFDHMNKSVECHDLSGHPLSRKKILKASELVNSISPEILLMNNCSLMHYALPLLNSKIKPVAVLHSDDKRFYKTASLFEKRIFRWIAPAKGVAERCRLYLAPSQTRRIHTIPHGINDKIFYTRKREGTKLNNNICFVGFIAENKGADLIPDIFNRVLREYKDARLTIIGQGPFEQTLKNICEANGTIDKIHFKGTANHEEIAVILRNSGILILPTRIEGFGLSVVEAMMSGAVPVVSRIKGITDDIVSDGINGVLIEPDDTKGFADAILGLLKDPVRMAGISEAARETAVSRYSADKMLDAYEALFAEKDDRAKISRRSNIGWFAETGSEIVRRGIDTKWIHRRIKELYR